MAFFNFRSSGLFDMAGARDTIDKIVRVFGDVQEIETNVDKGTSVLEAGQKMAQQKMPASVLQAQYYGNLHRYINYEESNKANKLAIYRQMSEYPEIFYALNTITDEVICKDPEGKVAEMVIENEDLIKNINKRDNLQKEWDYVYDEVCDWDRHARDIMFQFLITGEIFIEKVVNTEHLEKGILDAKRLLSDNTFVIYNPQGMIERFFVKNFDGTALELPKTQLAYANYGQFAYNRDTQERIVLSYLEPLKKIWRQLQLLEEAVLIYRVSRAPERRIFRIATGNLPRQQAEAYVEQTMRKYRQKKIYNTSTGEIDGKANILNMLEDYWFSQPETGQASSVDTLPAGENLGEIRDLDYFLKKLYRAMQIPESRRLDSEAKFNVGNVGEVTHQEIKFANLCNTFSHKMQDVMFDIFKTHLILKGFWKQYGLKDKDFRIRFNKNNHYEEFKRAQIMETKMNNWGAVSTYTGSQPGAIFSKEFALKKFLGFTEAEIEENKEQMKSEKEEDGAQQQPPPMGMMGGF
jgi:hypothetical protein